MGFPVSFRAQIEQQAAAFNIIVQSLPDIRAGIASNTSKNIDWLGQLEIAVGQCILSRVYEEVPFCVARMKSIVVYMITLLSVSGLPNLSAAVKALHVWRLLIPGL